MGGIRCCPGGIMVMARDHTALGLQSAIDAGATASIPPGGSIRDEEVIAAAAATDDGIAMVFTGHRHFRH